MTLFVTSSLLRVTVLLILSNVGSSMIFQSCMRKLGISNRTAIKDEQLTASSYLYGDRKAIYHFKPWYGRLHTQGGGGAWCSSSNEKGQYIQVDFLHNLKVNYIKTQGRYRGAEFVEKYRVRYQRDEDTHWRTVKNKLGHEHVFLANNDTDTVVGNRLPYSIIARRVRLYPTGDYFSIHCLRMEMYGCKFTNEFLVAYSSPMGVKFGSFDFTDRSYDGVLNNKTSILTNGLGELVDDYHGSNDLQTGWVGFNLSKIVFTFEFSREQSFRAIILRTRALVRSNKVFEGIEVSASSDGRNFVHVRTIISVLKGKKGDQLITGINVYSAKYIKCIIAMNRKNGILLVSEVSFAKGPPRRPTTQPDTTTKSVVTTRGTIVVGKETKIISMRRTERMEKTSTSSLKKTTKRLDSLLTIFDKDDTKVPQPRGGSKRTKSFYIILGIGTSVAALFTLLIIVLVCFLKRDKSDAKIKRNCNQSKRGSDATKVCEPLLKSSEFQGVCGTSKFIGPEIVVSGIPTEREIPRAAVAFENKIGGGKFGDVFIGQIICTDSLSVSEHNLVGQKVFIERLRQGASVETTAQFLDDVRLVSCLRHPNICRLVGVLTKSEPKFLLTECIEGMRLDTYLTSLNQATNLRKDEILADIVVKIASALKYLSSMKFVHRDIAARNVLFGLGNIVKLTNTAAACPGYCDCYCYMKEKAGLHPVRWMAPETLDDATCTVQSDIWSFGVLLWEIYTYAKVIPFERMGNIQVLDRLKALYNEGSGNIEYLPLKFLNCPTLITQIMLRCWTVSPLQRITADEIYETLSR